MADYERHRQDVEEIKQLLNAGSTAGQKILDATQDINSAPGIRETIRALVDSGLNRLVEKNSTASLLAMAARKQEEEMEAISGGRREEFLARPEPSKSGTKR